MAGGAESSTSVALQRVRSFRTGPGGPIRHHLPESETGPSFSRGRCMGESDSTETHPSKPVCDSDDRATKVASQVKNWFAKIGFQGSDPEQLTDRFRFGNLVEKF